MGLDLNFDYKKLKEKISATQAYNELKFDYAKIVNGVGDTIEKDAKKVVKPFSSTIKGAKKFYKKTKNQFEQLIDVTKVTKGSGANTLMFLKKLLLKTLKNIEPLLSDIVVQEAINAIGCDQQQTYNPSQPLSQPSSPSSNDIFIKVSAVDLFSQLKLDPNSDLGSILYERNPISIQDNPFSMNRELYERIQNPNVSYSSTNGNPYKGLSGQGLFDIEYTNTSPFGNGDWFRISLNQRANNSNTVSQFLTDYYKSIKVVEFEVMMSNIINSLSGAISFKADLGVETIKSNEEFNTWIQRILGICFDNSEEIDISGVAKVPEVDAIDDSFFELDDVDLRIIEQKVNNIKNGVMQFEDCGDVLLPMNADAVVQVLNNLRFVPDNQKVDAASQLTQSLTNNPEWSILAPALNFDLAIDEDFIKQITNGLMFSVLSPKVLLPIYTMLLSVGYGRYNQIINGINTIKDFFKKFKTFIINLISKASAIFIKEIFETIKKDLKLLIETVLKDIKNEKTKRITTIILKLIQLLFVVGQFISDWRKCKSVVDELIQLINGGLSIAQDIFGALTGQVPLPLLFASELLGGFSESRAFIGAIEELQKLGVPTGALPDGSANLTVLSVFAQIKAVEKEKTENGKVQVAIKPTAITPAGLTVPTAAFGIYL
jgi:hypothetical protein